MPARRAVRLAAVALVASAALGSRPDFRVSPRFALFLTLATRPAGQLLSSVCVGIATLHSQEQIIVPGGAFKLGTDEIVFPLDAEGPARPATVGPFVMDKYEVRQLDGAIAAMLGPRGTQHACARAFCCESCR